MANKDNSGVLFKEEKKSEKHPDYKGNCLINGKQMYIAAWINTAESGKKYMSLSFTDPATTAQYSKKDSTATSPPEFSKAQATTSPGDDLPF
tara:strand:- start:113 stop:388 length:276 start_codon:yes stop_codon:yes gene_type:complete